MARENLDGLTGIDAFWQPLKAAFVTTGLASERMLDEANRETDPIKRKAVFERFYSEFEAKPMADPLIYKSAILDAYGIVDSFAHRVIDQVSVYGVQDIFSRMENPYVLGQFLSEEHGMIHWPGFSTYSWVKNISWEDFENNYVQRNPSGSKDLRKVNPDLVGGKQIYSRFWFAYASMRSEYYNSDFVQNFDATFPYWRKAALELDAALLDRPNREMTLDRLTLRKYYIKDALPLMKDRDKRRQFEVLIDANPQIFSA